MCSIFMVYPFPAKDRYQKLNNLEEIFKFRKTFCKIHRKTLVLESLFKKLQAHVFFCTIDKICKNSFFYRTPPVVACEDGDIDLK